MAITIPNIFSANTLIKSSEVNADFSTLATAIPWASNPIAAKGDLIVGNTAGVSATLSAGAANQVLKVVNGTPTWSTFTGGINYAAANPDFEADTSGYVAYNDTQVVTITDNAPAVFTSAAAHGYSLGQKLTFTTLGVLPTGLTAGDTYYVSSVDSATDYKVSATLGGANIDTSSAGGGVHTQCPLTPITGTAGTASGLALTRSTVAPLRGTASGLITQTNATVVAGQGVGFAFTIDPADQAKPLIVSFDYNATDDFTASSGQTGSESDIEIFLQDVTNSVLIPVSPKVITAKGANNFSFQGQFQSSSNSVSYRLIYHCATANSPSTGFKLKIDNVFVGPQATAQGAPVIDWVPYNPASEGFGTLADVNVQWRRVGDTAYIKGYLTTGTTTATPGRLYLPTGLVISADTNNAEMAGKAVTAQDLGAQVDYQWVSQPSVPYVTLSRRYATGGTNNPLSVATNASDIIGTAYNLSFNEIAVKIAGWSSNVQMSQDADTRVVAAGAHLSTGTFTSDTTIPINFDTIEYDTHASITTGATTWKFTAPCSGKYRVSIAKFATDSMTFQNLSVYKNGSLAKLITGSNVDAYVSGTTAVDLIAGDYIDFRLSASVGVGDGISISIERLSGPATIAANEKVTAVYSTNSGGGSGGASNMPLNYNIKIKDTHSAVVTGAGTWKFTCPSSADYVVGISGINNQSNTTATYSVYKNGTLFAALGYATTTLSSGYSVVPDCLAGDYLDIRQDSTANPSNTTDIPGCSIVYITKSGT